MLDAPSPPAADAQPSAKWGEAARAGFQTVPDVLLKNQHRLGLTPTDLVVLINITMHWWYVGVLPFPRTTTVADRMGLDVRTIQRSMRRLEAMNLIEKVKVRTDAGEQVVYDLSGLVKALEKFAVSDPAYRPPEKSR